MRFWRTSTQDVEPFCTIELSYHLTRWSLVLTDFDMPRMDGGQLAHHVKTRSPATPVVLVTGNDTINPIKATKEAVFDAALFKPVSIDIITNTVQTLLHGTA